MTDAQPVSYAVAFTAGVLSFLSPCVLPLIPGYIAFLSGRSLDDLTGDQPSRALLWSTSVRALLFVAGFTLVFTALGASASAIGQLLSTASTMLSKIAGVVIVIFGLQTMGVLRIPWLGVTRQLNATRTAPGLWGALLVGMAFAFAWTPCIGPILASILALAATEDTVRRGILLLLVYSFGLGVPFLLTAVGLGTFLKFFARYKRFIQWGERGAGLLLVVLGLLVFSNRLNMLLKFVPATFSRFAR